MNSKKIEQIIRSGPIFRMQLGQAGCYQSEALASGALLFQMERGIYDAAVSGNEERIKRAAKQVQPEGKNWSGHTKLFRALPEGALVQNWHSGSSQLYWGIVDREPPTIVRDEPDDSGRAGYLVSRKLTSGWQTASLNGVSLTDIHPKARDFVSGLSAVSRVASHPDFFRALLLDENLSHWMAIPEWASKAKRRGWRPKINTPLNAADVQRAVPDPPRQIPDVVKQIANCFMSERDILAEAQRMAKTAATTACYANGQIVLRQVKNKELELTPEELEDEILRLWKRQDGCCALTGFRFIEGQANKHLLPSLDRKDSTKGYLKGNLQIVTRAANFYKSASDEADWKAKARAMELMALAIQKRRRARREGGV